MSRKMDGRAPDEQLTAGIRLLLGSQAGFHIGLAAQQQADDLTDLERAIACFFRLRRERELGDDLEAELAREEADAEVNRT